MIGQSAVGTSAPPAPRTRTEAIPLDPADLEDTEWTFRATELAALLAWTRGTIDRAGFRRWLRAERWPEEDLDALTALLEHLFATERRMPGVSRG